MSGVKMPSLVEQECETEGSQSAATTHRYQLTVPGGAGLRPRAAFPRRPASSSRAAGPAVRRRCRSGRYCPAGHGPGWYAWVTAGSFPKAAVIAPPVGNVPWRTQPSSSVMKPTRCSVLKLQWPAP